MNDLTVCTTLTMSSREIAELTGKSHKHVLADIRGMLKSLVIDSAEFSAQYKDSTGRKLACFNLPKRETLILVSGYDVQMRARIIDRWQELEESLRSPQPQFHIPQTMSEALRLAADLSEQNAIPNASECFFIFLLTFRDTSILEFRTFRRDRHCP